MTSITTNNLNVSTGANLEFLLGANGVGNPIAVANNYDPNGGNLIVDAAVYWSYVSWYDYPVG